VFHKGDTLLRNRQPLRLLQNLHLYEEEEEEEEEEKSSQAKIYYNLS
jgi:hypothetical protein